MSGEPLSRRQAIRIGLLGAGSLAIGATGLATQGWPPFGPAGAAASPPGRSAAGGRGLVEPQVIDSVAGTLDLDLLVAEADVVIDGATVRMLTYNGTVPGPTLHLQPGDRLRVHLTNGLDEPTNLHTHGLEVSPAGSSDNPFLRIDPGESFDYTIELPADHPTGVFWYHPHHHGMVADQVFGGLYGAIVVDAESWAQVRPRVLVVSDVTLAGGRIADVSRAERRHGRVGETVLVNGRPASVLAGRAGATHRLLLVNACTSRYLDLDLGGEQMLVRGLDGGRPAEPQPRERLLLAPGNRATLDVTVPTAGAVLTARAHDRGAPEMGMRGRAATAETDATLLTLRADASATQQPEPGEPAVWPLPRDLRAVDVARRRTLELTMGMGMGGGGMRYLIDGRAFDSDRVDQQVRLGDVEEWTLRNATAMDHPFHLHVWPMQLLSTGGSAAPGVDRRDVVDVPAGTEVLVRIAFERFSGTTVYHCHVLDHEDLGMMGTVRVD